MTTTITPDEMRSSLVEKAMQDQAFRARLLEEPNAAIEETLGVTVPDAMTVKVLQDTATTAHLILPPAAELEVADLEAIAAGHVWKRGLYSDSTIPHQHPAGT